MTRPTQETDQMRALADAVPDLLARWRDTHLGTSHAALADAVQALADAVTLAANRIDDLEKRTVSIKVPKLGD